MRKERTDIKLSLVIPVFNRPEEVGELLQSLVRQTNSDFEVIVVEDGSDRPCDKVVATYAEHLRVRYFNKPNSGPGLSRNFGLERMEGNFGVVLDSDCVIPEGYIAAVIEGLRRTGTDAFGGPDRADDGFTPVQKAINYAMTSVLTTGGIRGGQKALDRFYPRSFNMGFSREVFQATGGFGGMRFGEDIDLSIRILKVGFRTALFTDAWVYHKRRTKWRQFFRQVFNSGIARINLNYRHPGTLKLVHLLPSAFTIGIVLTLVLALAGYPIILALPALWSAMVGVHAGCLSRSFLVGVLAIWASVIQLTGYGSGLLWTWWNRSVRGRGELTAFESTFYK